jgi:hypothetical protein
LTSAACIQAGRKLGFIYPNAVKRGMKMAKEDFSQLTLNHWPELAEACQDKDQTVQKPSER